MRQARLSPSVGPWSWVNLSTRRPIFLPRLLERKPRTLCDFQLVADWISASVAPSGRRSRSRTMAFLLPGRASRGSVSGVALGSGLLPRRVRGRGRRVRGGGRQGPDGAPDAATAVLRSVNSLTGFRSPKVGTSAKLFQTSTKRPIGQAAVSLVRSFPEEKVAWSSGIDSPAR
jgi:hypothetical protein